MDFIDRIHELSARAPKQLDYCLTEEATKNALVLPFIAAMGYDVFNPAEVMPEMTADFGTKKGEKVDYAIFRDGKPAILFECKKAGVDLGNVHASQLYRYFSVLPDVRFGILTNGIEYRFFSDLEKPNVMDDKPFFVFNVLEYEERHVNELKKFSKSVFNLEEILATASELKYTAAIQNILRREFDAPSDDFVAYLARQVYSGRLTQSAREQFSVITQKALRRFMTEQVNARLQSALHAGTIAEQPAIESAGSDIGYGGDRERPDAEDEDGQARARGIVTTEEEIEAYFAVKSILRELIDVTRVHIRDQKSYCNVLLDDTNRKPICRLYFNRAQKYLGLFDGNSRDDRVAISDIDEIYDYAGRLVATVKAYDSQMPPPPPAEATDDDAATESVTGKRATAVIIFGQRQPVSTWKEVWFAVIAGLRARDAAKFEQVAATFRGRVRPYFSHRPGDLRTAERVPGSSLYVETNLGAWSINRFSYRLMRLMGYDESELEILSE